MMTTPLRKGNPVAKPAKEEPAISFLNFIQSHRRGEIPTEGDVALTDILTAIREHGGKGKLTLTMNIKMNKSGQIEITPDLKSEKPRRAMSAGLYFATDEGALTRRDPDQGDWVDEITPRRDLDS